MLARLLLLFFALAFIEVHAKKSQNVVLRVCPEENLPTDDPHEPPHLCQDFEMTGSGLDMKSIREMIRVETAALIKKDWYDKKIREKKYEDAVKVNVSEEQSDELPMLALGTRAARGLLVLYKTRYFRYHGNHSRP